jgi:DNA-binding transcriptional LysR family regulator
MQDLNDFAWFVQVVDHGGFAAAGRALDQPKSNSAAALRNSRSGWACV